MSNSHGTLAVNLIAEKTLEFLSTRLPILSEITTDFSDVAGPVAKGSTIISKIVAGDTAQDFDGATGYAPSALSASDVSVTLNKHKYKTFELTLDELNTTNADLIARYAQATYETLGNAIYTDLSTIAVASGTFTNSVLVTGTFARKDIFKARATLNTNKAPMTRFAIINNADAVNLWDDSVVISNQGSVTVGASELPPIGGIKISEFDLPANGASPLNTFAVVGARNSLVMASRPLVDESQGQFGYIVKNFVDPRTNLTLQMRVHGDPKFGKVFVTYAVLYGVAAGDTSCLVRIRK